MEGARPMVRRPTTIRTQSTIILTLGNVQGIQTCIQLIPGSPILWQLHCTESKFCLNFITLNFTTPAYTALSQPTLHCTAGVGRKWVVPLEEDWQSANQPNFGSAPRRN